MSQRPQDRVNRVWYDQAWAREGLAAMQGFSDQGESAAYWRLADRMRGRPILDLGVGPGRTVPLLRSLTADYVGLDYVQAMVNDARGRYPIADIRLGDARDLREFPDGRFAMVVFSYNGIDSVPRDGREQVLREAWRVLMPGGVFWFSTLNIAGPAFRYRPWRPLPPESPKRALGWLRYLTQWLRAWTRVPAHTIAYLHGRHLVEHGEGWAIAPFFAGNWRLIVHYASLHTQLADLARAGFDAEPEVFEDAGGTMVDANSDLSAIFSFNLLVTKPQAVGAGVS